MKYKTYKIALIFGFLIIVILALNNFISAYNYEQVNITTRVNITNARPEIDRITIDQNITLTAGGSKSVRCNVSVHDWNGYQDIVLVNATFWDANNYVDANNNNSFYSNTSCTNYSGNGYYANFTCGFDVWYYANNGTDWRCNVTIKDGYGFNASNYNTSSIQPLYALNVTPLIDFGDMAVGDIKNNITANVTNLGNMPINISVAGFGGTSNVTGAGYAMICAIRNITIANLKYTINMTDWNAASATSLSSTNVNVTGLTVPKRITDQTWNQTYWHLYVPPSENPFGVCNGTVVFSAWSSG
jgi:hypothetical protein